MQMTDETAEAALQAVKRFRIGGVAAAMIPLIPGFVNLIQGDRIGDASILNIMTMSMLLLVVWGCHCAERFVKTMRAAPQS